MSDKEQKYRVFSTDRSLRDPGDFSWIGFQKDDTRSGSMTKETLLQGIEVFSKDNGLLNLSGNNLGKSEEGLVPAIFSKITPTTITLDLSFNAFYRMDLKLLMTNFSLIPKWIKKLDISQNQLGTFDIISFKQLMFSLPQTISEINIGHNRLNNYSRTELLAVIKEFDQRLILPDFENDQQDFSPS